MTDYAMDVIAIDPSLACTGIIWCHSDIESATCFSVQTKKESGKRGIYQADDDVRRVLEVVNELNHEHGPCKVVIERSGGSQSARAAKAIGIITGALASWAHTRGHEVLWVNPRDAKSRLAGSPKASKAEMVTAAKGLQCFPDPGKVTKPQIEAIADAFGVLLASNIAPRWLLDRSPSEQNLHHA